MEIQGMRGSSSHTQQLAWKLAGVAADRVESDDAVAAVINRIIDNTAVALAAINKPLTANARSQAVAHPHCLHPRSHGARIFGLPAARRCSVEWAAWANAIALREPGIHDGADGVSCADNIPPILAAAQQCGRDGADLLRGIVAACELHLALDKLVGRRQGVDPAAHLAAAAAGGIGACLNLDSGCVYRAIWQSLWISFDTRAASGWTSYAVAHAGKMAVEIVDRSMRGATLSWPTSQSEEGALSGSHDSSQAQYHIALPAAGERQRAILDSRSFGRADSIRKFQELADGLVSDAEQQRFLRTVQRLPQLAAGELGDLNVVVDRIELLYAEPDGRGIF